MTVSVTGAFPRSVSALALLCAAGPRLAAQTQPLDALANRYCIGCHNDRLRTGGISLVNASAASADVREKAFRKLRSGEMPPAGMPAPDAAMRAVVVHSLETNLDQAEAAHPDPGAPGIHRLNRAEYRNAVRDLLALDLDTASANAVNLPPDDSGYGFDNIADVLTVSPLHMENYLASARRISHLALGTLKPKVSSEKISPIRGTPDDSIGALPPEERGGLMFRRDFPFDAEYSFLLRVRGNPAPGLPPAKLDLRIDGRRVKLFDASIDTAEANQGTRNFEVRLKLSGGEHVVGAGFLKETAKVESTTPGRGPAPASVPNGNSLAVEYITLGGPYNPTGPGDSESRRKILICHPVSGQPEETCARQIVANLAHHAYRRPVTVADLVPLLKLFAAGRADGNGFDAGIELALSGILVSPDFLFRSEAAPRHGDLRISDLELASRLSFFLWSSIPDDELLRVAEAGKLHEPDTLATQVRRLIADPKSQAFEENFAGQWLHLRNVPSWAPDPEKYPQFDESLRLAFERESDLFFTNIMREDRSVLEFIDADYTFLNDRLARHYGVPNVKGSYFRRVELKDKQRGGVLSQGSVLLVTSYPTRTSPVLRGKWILENIMGAPPPPPPPNIPPLAESASNSARSLREQLEKHRADRACASCHSRLDPLGFSLEQYDAIGRFRTEEDGTAIEATGSLPDGTALDGPEDLKTVVLARRDEFVECLASKMLTYALGRGLEYYDQPAVRAIRREAASEDYRFSSLILGIANSVPFQMRRP
jgi:cytochrome c551/c552